MRRIILSGRSHGFGFVAAACALLAVDWVVLRVSSVEESKVDIVAYHRACCVDKELHPIAAVDSHFFDKWAQTLSMFDGISCIHTYGLGVKANSCEDCDWPKAIHNEDWTFRREHVKGDVLSDDLSCAAIQLFVADTNPIEHPLGAFTPELIRELTKRKPKVTIETGFAFRQGSTIKFHSRDRSDYLYDRVYEADKVHEADKKTKRKKKIFSDEVRRTIVTREMIKEALPRDSLTEDLEGVIAFLNYAADGRAPRKQEAKFLLMQNQLESILTTDKLDAAKFSSKMEELWHSLGRPDGADWMKKVPFDNLIPATVQKLRRKEKQTRDHVSKHHDHRKADLTRVGTKALRDALLLGIYRLAHESTESRLKLSGITRAGDKNPPNPEELTEFLLVNSLLTVSNSSHEKVFIEAVEDELASQRRPIFSVCAPKIQMSPSSAGRNFLSVNYRFTIEGQSTVAYSYGTLSDIPVTEKGLPKDHTDGDDGNAGVDCVMLALQNVSESEFQDLGRKRLTVLMAVTRSARLRDRPHVVMGDARQGVDLWSYFSGEDSQPIHQLFDKFGEEIKKTGSWLPALVDEKVERSRAKASRNERRKSTRFQRLEKLEHADIKKLTRSARSGSLHSSSPSSHGPSRRHGSFLRTGSVFSTHRPSGRNGSLFSSSPSSSRASSAAGSAYSLMGRSSLGSNLVALPNGRRWS